MEDMLATCFLVVTLLFGAAVCAIIGKKMGKGELGPNALVGIRTQRAYRSEADWYAVQSACAPRVLLLAFIFLDSAILFAVDGFFNEPILSVAVLVIVLAQTVVGLVLLIRAALACNKQP